MSMCMSIDTVILLMLCFDMQRVYVIFVFTAVFTE